MKAQDFQNFNNNRAEAIAKLQEICVFLGLDYEYTEKLFKIKLPAVEEMPVTTNVVQRRKTFDISSWGPPGVDETVEAEDGELPTELPEATTPLTEGEPPVGDDEDNWCPRCGEPHEEGKHKI